jgi:hypothetical protein
MKPMIRDWGPDFTAATSVILTNGGIRTVLCIVRTPPHERDRGTWVRDAAATRQRSKLTQSHPEFGKQIVLTVT